MDFQSFQFADVLLVLGGCMGLALAGAIILLIIAARQIAQIEIPEDADFFETLELLPITVPVALDLLDMAFDIFSAPISWIVLELLGLRSLQLITIVEGLIPGTQVIPTMTLAWILARVMKSRQRGRSRMQEEIYQYQQLDRAERYRRLGAGRGDIVSRYRRQPLLLEENVDGEFVEEEEELDYFQEDDIHDDY
jgi:hypothetical protein